MIIGNRIDPFCSSGEKGVSAVANGTGLWHTVAGRALRRHEQKQKNQGAGNPKLFSSTTTHTDSTSLNPSAAIFAHCERIHKQKTIAECPNDPAPLRQMAQ
jgi:hypothetical protein